MKFHLVAALSTLGYLTLTVVSQVTPLFPLSLFLSLQAFLWLCFALAYKGEKTISCRAIILWAVLFRLIAIFAIPLYEDDYFRFLWDGMLFAETGNPYGKVPADYFSSEWVPDNFVAILDQINYPAFPTIYGIVTELAFLLAYYIAPGSTLGLQIVFALADLAFCLAIYSLKGKKGLFIVAWCPLLIVETYVMLHPEIIAVAALTAALLFASQGKQYVASGLLSLSVSARVFALPLVPFFLLQFSRRAMICCGLFTSALFLASGVGGDSASGVTKTFLSNFEFNSSGFFLLSLLLGSASARFVGVSIFALGLLTLFYFYRKNRNEVGHKSQYLKQLPGETIFVLLLCFSPIANPWYFLWLLPFVALRPRLSVFVLLATANLSYFHAGNTGILPAETAFEVPLIIRAVEFIPPALILLYERKLKAPQTTEVG